MVFGILAWPEGKERQLCKEQLGRLTGALNKTAELSNEVLYDNRV
jgi:hypothetical protein